MARFSSHKHDQVYSMDTSSNSQCISSRTMHDVRHALAHKKAHEVRILVLLFTGLPGPVEGQNLSRLPNRGTHSTLCN
jgi:hypothetical protein